MYITSFINIIFKTSYLYYISSQFINLLTILEIYRISNKHKKRENNQILKSYSNIKFCENFLYRKLFYFLKYNSYKIYSYSLSISISLIYSEINYNNLMQINCHNNTLLDLKAYSKIVVSPIGTPRIDGGFDL